MNSARYVFCLFALTALICAYSINIAQTSVMSDPQYFVQAELIKIEDARGGVHTLSFKIKGLVADQAKYGGHYPPASLNENLSDKDKIFNLQITLNPEATVKQGDKIVVGVVHGSSMGENGAVEWTMFAHPYLECGTPIGIFY